MKKQYKIVDEAGLHARPASLLVKKATSFDNDIFIIYKDKRVTLKSIMVVLSLGVTQNETIELDVLGDNPEVVMAALEEVLVSNNLL